MLRVKSMSGKNFWKYSFYLVMVLIIVLSAKYSASTYSNSFNDQNIDFEKKKQPLAENGILDLSQWNFKNGGFVNLDGEWDLYWHRLVGYEVFSSVNEAFKTGHIRVPSFWQGQIIGNTALSNDGYGTYTLTIKTGNTDEVLAMKTSRQISNYKIWANNKLLAEAGNVSSNRDESKGGFFPEIITLKPENKEIKLVVQISSYGYAGAGFVSSFTLGNYKDIESSTRKQSTMNIFFFGCLVIMGIYHMALFILRPKEKSYLYFCIVCILISIRTLFIGEELFYYLFYWVPLDLGLKLAMIFLSICMIFFTLFIKSLFPEYKVSKFLNVLIGIDIICSAIILVVSNVDSINFQLPYMFSCLFMLVVLYPVLFKAVRDKRPGARIILGGVMIVLICAINDTFNRAGLIKTPLLIPFGAMIFILSQSFLLSMKFSRSFNTVEVLSKRLMSLDKLKDEFLANTSHELRTPLSGMIGIAQSMIKGATGSLDDEKLQNLSMIVSCGRRLSSLVDDILDFSRLKNNELKLNLITVDLKQISDMVIMVLNPLAHSKGLELFNEIPQNLSLVTGDENRIQQIFFNLLGNAIKFTEKGFVRISAHQKGDFVFVSIIDSGIGIPEDRYEDIFKPFEQLDSSATRNYEGTGIGLSITKQLVELSGGKIFVNSTIGEGSVFTFSIPVSKEKTSQNKNDIQIVNTNNLVLSDKSQNTSYLEDRASILVVDDDLMHLKILSNVLSLQNYSVTVEGSGEKALELLMKESFDLLILDIMMPKLSGYQICNTIRKNRSMSELPILMLTAKDRPHDIAAAFEVGANDYLSKPFDETVLLARVKSLFTLKELIIHDKKLLRTEIKALQAQIKPHFLFNALNTIVSCIRIDSEKAIELLHNLSDYLRSSFSFKGNDDYIPFESELLHVKSYLFLEKARFGDRLNVVYNIEDKVSCRVPPLILQPIVENAIKHGLLPKPQGGTVTITASYTGSDLILQVEDDGVGIHPEKLKTILTDFPTQERRGIGILNVNERMEKIYGRSLKIESIVDIGTKVTITIPGKR